MLMLLHAAVVVAGGSLHSNVRRPSQETYGLQEGVKERSTCRSASRSTRRSATARVCRHRKNVFHCSDCVYRVACHCGRVAPTWLPSPAIELPIAARRQDQ